MDYVSGSVLGSKSMEIGCGLWLCAEAYILWGSNGTVYLFVLILDVDKILEY